MEKRQHSPNIAADPIGAVLILSGPPDDNGTAPAILLRSDGSATALHAIPGADGVWSLSEPIEQLTPEKVRQCFLGMTAIRKEAAQEIDRLIALLDRIDPDRDCEEQGDNDDDKSADEPSLGSIDNFANQERWAMGNNVVNARDVDCEDEHDGREPSLGSTSVHDQTMWAWGSQEDREHDAGDEPEEERYY